MTALELDRRLRALEPHSILGVLCCLQHPRAGVRLIYQLRSARVQGFCTRCGAAVCELSLARRKQR